jgi:hypothetical protein
VALSGISLATFNQKLESGDKIRTGEDGQATLTLDDASTIELFPQTEFAVQSLAKDSATQQLESVVAILRGKLRADVKPQPAGSTFEFETPVMVAAVLGTTPQITVNADGSVNVLNEAGEVALTSTLGTDWTASLDTGDEAQGSYNPDTGETTLLCVSGSFNVVMPDGTVHTLNAGDKITLAADGAATFIPAGGGGAPGAPTGDTFSEPPGTDPTDTSAAGILAEEVTPD